MLPRFAVCCWGKSSPDHPMNSSVTQSALHTHIHSLSYAYTKRRTQKTPLMIREVGSGWRSWFKVNVAPSAKSYWQRWSFSLSCPSPIGASITANHIIPSLFGAQQVDRGCNTRLAHVIFWDWRHFSKFALASIKVPSAWRAPSNAAFLFRSRR